MHQLIVTSFNVQSLNDNDTACMRCEISTSIKGNGVDPFFVTETLLCAQGDEVKTAEISATWILHEIIPTSIALSWRGNCYNLQIKFRL